MNEVNDIRRNWTGVYVGFVLVSLIWRSITHNWLHQLLPVSFAETINLNIWVMRWSGWIEFLVSHRSACIAFDILFYAANMLLPLLALRKNINALIILLLVLNWVAVDTYATAGINSQESLITYYFVPLIFLQARTAQWLIIPLFLRLLFLWFFCSTGFWKLFRGSLFSIDQMSTIFLQQHKDLLALAPQALMSRVYWWFIQHKAISQSLFIIVSLAEMSFVLGFFSFRFDRLFFWLYCLFILLDLLFMRILFWETIPFALVLLYSSQVKAGLKSAH